MSADQLRAELARVADDAPVALVADDTWGRARRARTRDRALGVLGAAAAVALVVGLATTVLPGRDTTSVASGDALGLPDRLYAVPTRMADRHNDESWSRSEVSDALAIGRGAAAWVMNEGLPVVVGAADGVYHLLDLPGFSGNDRLTMLSISGAPGLALSPDGRRLAYGYGDPGPGDDNRPVPSGVRVVDLETGDVREVPVPGGEGTLVGRIRFSSDGEWIVWAGDVLAAWTQGQVGGRTATVGRIAPGATASEPVVLGGALDTNVGTGTSGDLAIDDSGVVVAVVRQRVVRWDGGVIGQARLEVAGVGQVAVRADGQRVAVSGGAAADLGTFDPRTGRFDALSVTSGAKPLGFGGDGYVVAVTTTYADNRLVLAGPSGTDEVAVVERDVGSLSVAVDLIGRDRLGVTRPAPDWPWSDERRSAVIGVGVALAVAALLGLRWAWRRRRFLQVG